MALHEPRTAGTEAYVRIYNSDGSPAEACGNGMRCVGWQVAQRTGRNALKFETVAGVLDVSVRDRGCITVDMGKPSFGWREIPLAEVFQDTRAIELQIGPIDKPVLHTPSVANVGNPHAIFWVDNVNAFDLGRLGPMLEQHPIFPQGANISLAKVTSPTSISLRTWNVTVTLPGGPLSVEWRGDDRIFMTGPVELEHEGTLTLETA
jgi:diaminopimelate epimerase